MSLVARHLEACGIPTVVVGSARDIVEHCGVPRFLFTDFPLGNPCGLPFDVDMQREVAGMAIALLEDAPSPRTTSRTPFVWPGGDAWKAAYLRVDAEGAERLRAAGDHRRTSRDRAKSEGRARSD